MRIAVLDKNRCKPKKCGHECYKFCPGVRARRETISFPEGQDKPPVIAENLCSGSGICVKKCPYHAIKIVNLPEELDKDMIHRFGENEFTLFRMPVVREKAVTGLIGENGIGKTTAVKILCGEVQLNLGNYKEQVAWETIIEYFRGSELQGHFEKIAKGELRAIHKPQYVDRIPKVVKSTVKELFDKIDEAGNQDHIKEILELEKVWNRKVPHLSGGELQKVAVGVALVRDADTYFFDEPSSYLDVYERLRVGRIIRELSDKGKTVLVVEHDLALLDYLSDYVCIFYGDTGAYGIVSHPHGVREGINIFLEGYLPDDNMRFRDTQINFRTTAVPRDTVISRQVIFSYGRLSKTFDGGENGDGFGLEVIPGEIHEGEVIGILGPNAVGKTTFVKLIAGIEEPTKGELVRDEELQIAYKPQYLSTSEDITVQQFLDKATGTIGSSAWFKSEVYKPLRIENLMEKELTTLSGGELQKIAIAACLAKEADLYLFDEPFAYLSIDDRLKTAKVIRRLVQGRNRAAFVVEHDIVFQDYVSDSLMVFLGEGGVRGTAYPPSELRKGMNQFLRDLAVTFRRDGVSGRPRVNKPNSRMDKEQVAKGEYYYLGS